MGPFFLITALVLNALANISMKLGAQKLIFEPSLKSTELIKLLVTNYFLWLGIGMFGLNVVFYIVALSKMNLSIAYPIMTAGGFLIITAFSFFYLKEPLTSLQLLGIILLSIGITLVAYKF